MTCQRLSGDLGRLPGGHRWLTETPHRPVRGRRWASGGLQGSSGSPADRATLQRRVPEVRLRLSEGLFEPPESLVPVARTRLQSVRGAKREAKVSRALGAPMPEYARFAKYYDAIYNEIVDYPKGCDYLEALFRKFTAKKPASVLDLGTGTGNHAMILARRGYDVTGLDRSPHQLREARKKVRGTRLPVRFVEADMARFDLHRRFDAAICMFGGFGHLLTDRWFESHFASVRRHLAAGGVYAFEFWHRPAATSPYTSWVYRQKPYEIIRLDRSHVDRRRSRLVMDFRFSVLGGGRVVDRFREVHEARLFTMPEMRALLARSRLRLLATYGVTPAKPGFGPVRKDTFRVMAVVRPIPVPLAERRSLRKV